MVYNYYYLLRVFSTEIHFCLHLIFEISFLCRPGCKAFGSGADCWCTDVLAGMLGANTLDALICSCIANVLLREIALS